MQYKGFVAKYFYDVRSGVFIGEVTNASQVIVFSAETVESLEQAMIEAINSYLACADLEVIDS